jgi:hypothetical protein
MVAIACGGVLIRSSLRCWKGIRRRSAHWGTPTQSGANPCGGFTAPMDIQLLANVMNVVFDRRRFDTQLPGDLLVRQAAIDQLRDLQLAS